MNQTKVVNKHSPIILASKSAVRKQQMIDAGMPFEVIVSDADETPNETKSFRAQLAEIAMRKANVVLNQTSERKIRLIIAADLNIVFDGHMYGKPENIDIARKLINSMQGRNDIYAYTGNAVLIADGAEVLESTNITDISRLSMDKISDEELEDYLENQAPLTKCGGFSITDAPFVHLQEGRYSTACGMTIEIAQEMSKAL